MIMKNTPRFFMRFWICHLINNPLILHDYKVSLDCTVYKSGGRCECIISSCFKPV